MIADKKKKTISRVNRIAGQIAGVQRMMQDNRYCVDILHQIAAIRSALDALGLELITQHLETCVVGHGGPKTHDCAKALSRDQLLEEVRKVLSQFLK